MSGIADLLPDADAYHLTAWLFVRGVGVTATVAMISLLVQLPGLFGSRGVVPLGARVRRLRRHPDRWRRTPSLLLLDASDRALWVVAGLGLAAALLVTVDILTVPALVVVAVTYLSFASVGTPLLSYQWDVLLIEATVVAVLVAAITPPSPPALLLVWLLAFRLHFTSGAVKLTSGDPTWRGLTALTVHFETQPLPNRLAWWAHQLPRSVHRAATFLALFLELAVPVLVLTPWPLRAGAVAGLLTLQIVIQVTGSYGFFNLLAVVLLVPLVPDAVWPGDVAGVDLAALVPAGGSGAPAVVEVVVGVAAVALGTLQVLWLVTLVSRPRWLLRIVRALAPFRIVNPYGLFASMTTTRPEIVIEGSDDGGASWRPYRFRWKVTDPHRPPRIAAPHQPRLDWQLWFAALKTAREAGWVDGLLRRLREASPPVLRLLAHDPFDGSPPDAVRAVRYRYTFTDRATRRETGRWWDRERLGLYHPPVRGHGGAAADAEPRT